MVAVSERITIALLAAGLLVLRAGGADAGYLGVRLSAVDLPEGGGGGSGGGIRLDHVVPLGPAARAGLRDGDIIFEVDGAALSGRTEEMLAPFQERLRALPPGSSLALSVIRLVIEVRPAGGAALTAEERKAILSDLGAFLRERGAGYSARLDVGASWQRETTTVELGEAPGRSGPALPPTEALFPGARLREHPIAGEIEAWLEEHRIAADTADLRGRLARLTERGDRSRTQSITLIHREPYRLPSLARHLAAGFEKLARSKMKPEEALDRALVAAALPLDHPAGDETPPRRLPRRALAPEAHLDLLAEILDAAAADVRASLAELSEDEIGHVVRHWRDLGDRFAEAIYLHTDPQRERLDRNLRTVAAGEKLDSGRMLLAARRLAPILERAYLQNLRRDLEKAGVDLTGGIALRRETHHGVIAISGDGDTWHRDRGIAILIDLGGDDFYGNAAGATVDEERGSREWRRHGPVSLLVEVGGDDAYESTHDGTQGTGILGLGILADLRGDDTYIGGRWAQGSGFLGIGVLLDASGDDVYRCHALSQGAALFGAGLLLDLEGNDRYEGHRLAQAVGMPGGAGILLDAIGADSYYSKGTSPTGYGDEGIFDAWSQGCAVGFRTIASGGVALLIDGRGKDRYEAGNFSQGGGYYYGFGALLDTGRSPDHYIGSRYNQGFSAHQAAGFFLDEGGDDRYETRQAVVSGLAWDECVTFFIDRAGDDIYEGGGFSLGASAHNSITCFLDLDGRDTYLHGQIARAGGNDYHGGTSLSVFVDDGGEADRYRGELHNGMVKKAPEHGIFVDR